MAAGGKVLQPKLLLHMQATPWRCSLIRKLSSDIFCRYSSASPPLPPPAAAANATSELSLSLTRGSRSVSLFSPTGYARRNFREGSYAEAMPRLLFSEARAQAGNQSSSVIGQPESHLQVYKAKNISRNTSLISNGNELCGHGSMFPSNAFEVGMYTKQGSKLGLRAVLPGRPFFSSARLSEKEMKEIQTKEDVTKPLVLYRGRWMRTFRLLVRLKVLQLVGVATLALPIAEYTQEGHLSLGTITAVGAVVGGATAASAALWYYSRRYIGELALLPPDFRRVRISVLDFWGRRQDLVLDRSAIVPPLKGMSKSELMVAAQQTLIPLDVVGVRQFVLSIRHGNLADRARLIGLLDGSLDSEQLNKHVVVGQDESS